MVLANQHTEDIAGSTKLDKGEITIDGKVILIQGTKVALMPQRSSMNWKFPHNCRETNCSWTNQTN